MTSDWDASVEIIDSNLDLESIFSVLDDVAGPELKSQDNLVLIVPSDLSGRYEGIAFPGGTRELFRYLRECAGNQATVEATVRDEEYREFQFLSVDIILPTLYVAETVLVPMVIGMLSDWIRRHRRSAHDRDKDPKVKSEVHFDHNGRLRKLNYEGPVSTYENILLEVFRKQQMPTPPDENNDDTTAD